MDWRSIDEPEDLVVLRGIVAGMPRAYEDFYGRRLHLTRRDRFIQALRAFASFAFSGVMHLLILVLLAEIVILVHPAVEETIVSMGLSRSPEPKPVERPGEPDKSDLPEKAERPKASPNLADTASDEPVDRSNTIGSSSDSTIVNPATTGVVDATSDIPYDDIAHLTGTGLLDGRGETGRRGAVSKYGGSTASEEAVERGLEWLARHQDDDGRWSAAQFTKHCPGNDRCGGEGSGADQYDHGVTGLALLAFLSAGYTHQNGKHMTTVRKAVDWIVSRQDSAGFYFDSGRYGGSTTGWPGGMYGHGVCTFALGEAAAMTRDEALKKSLEKAVRAIESSQQSSGGWYYSINPREGKTEFTLSVWQMMGLKASKLAGVKVPEDVIDKAKGFVRKSTTKDGGVYYWGTSNVTLGATAAGLFARCMFGLTEEGALEKGMGYLDKSRDQEPQVNRRQSWEYLYYWYYRSLVAFQMQGRRWKQWNDKIRPFLVGAQHQEGHRAGSWSIIDYNHASRVYGTSMCILMLEVYYRYLPMASDRSAISAIDEAVDDGMPEETPLEREIARKKKAAEEPRKTEAEERAAAIQDAYQRLESRNSFDRYLGARRLSELGVKEAWEKMIAAAEKESGNIKAVMIVYVGRLKEEKSLPWLMRQLDDADEKIRVAAMDGLMQTTGVYITEPDRWKAWYKDRQK